MACLTCAALPRCAIDATAACSCIGSSTWLFVGDSVIRGVWSRLGQWLLEADGLDIHRDAQIASLQRARVGDQSNRALRRMNERAEMNE